MSDKLCFHLRMVSRMQIVLLNFYLSLKINLLYIDLFSMKSNLNIIQLTQETCP